MRSFVTSFLGTLLVSLAAGCGGASDPGTTTGGGTGCPAGTVACSSGCSALVSDPLNCGACGNVCSNGLVCSSNQCSTSCAAGQTACGAGCTDPLTDPNNCGTCGTVCASGTCSGGACFVPTIPSNWHGLVTTAVTAETLQNEYSVWKSRFLLTCPNSELGVKQDNSTNAVVSEGIAYGMLIAAGMKDQATFNGLFNYYYHRRDAKGLMNWKYTGCSNSQPVAPNAGSATDADLDAAMALLQAEKLWPGNGYLTNFANPLLNAIRASETISCNGRLLLLPGDGWGQGCGNLTTNPSYFATGYFHVLAARDPANATTWNKLAADAYALLSVNSASAPNGLFTDWANATGAPVAGVSSIQYGYDACRTPWRLATDVAWLGDAQAKAALTKVANYVASAGGPMKTAYLKNSAFAGAFALSGQVVDQATFDAWVSQWLTGTGTYETAYFPGTLRMVYLLLATGNFDSTL